MALKIKSINSITNIVVESAASANNVPATGIVGLETSGNIEKVIEDDKVILVGQDYVGKGVITISGNEISANLNDYYNVDEVNDFLDEKQDLLLFDYDENSAISAINGSALAGQGGNDYIAGSMIDITNNTINIKNNNCVILGENAIAVGSETSAIGDYSVAEGESTIANGYASHAEGTSLYLYDGETKEYYTYYVLADGYSTHAEGEATSAIAEGSHTEGYQSIAEGGYGHAEGWRTSANGWESHAEGECNVAEGDASHAEGSETSALGWASHAEGNLTITNGNNAHAEGYDTSALGKFTHTEGEGTIANSDWMHAGGSYNATSADVLFVIGNGYWDYDNQSACPSDAFVIYPNGQASATDFVSNGVSLSALAGYKLITNTEYNALTAAAAIVSANSAKWVLTN